MVHRSPAIRVEHGEEESPFVVGVALATAEDEIAMAGGGTKGVAFVRALRDVVDLAMAGDTESAREWLGAALRDFPGQP